MSIEEEIKILENALSGALLVPSECAFVNTEIIKICLDTLKTYESWELLIRHEIEKQIRAEVIDELYNKIDEGVCDICEHQDFDAGCYKTCTFEMENAKKWLLGLKEQK